MRFIPLPSIHPASGRASRGCVSHLPAPGCFPDQPVELERPCFPLLDLLERNREVTPDRRNPTAGRRTVRRPPR